MLLTAVARQDRADQGGAGQGRAGVTVLTKMIHAVAYKSQHMVSLLAAMLNSECHGTAQHGTAQHGKARHSTAQHSVA